MMMVTLKAKKQHRCYLANDSENIMIVITFLKAVNIVNWLEMVTAMMNLTISIVISMEVTVAIRVQVKYFAKIVNVLLEIMAKK